MTEEEIGVFNEQVGDKGVGEEEVLVTYVGREMGLSEELVEVVETQMEYHFQETQD